MHAVKAPKPSDRDVVCGMVPMRGANVYCSAFMIISQLVVS